MADDVAQVTERLDISYPGRNQKNAYETYKSGVEATASIMFSLMETNTIIVKGRPNVIVELVGPDYVFKQDDDTVLISRTTQSSIVIEQEDVVLIQDSMIGIPFVSGATTESVVNWTLYQSNMPVDADILPLGYVREDYTIIWFNGSYLGKDVTIPLFVGTDGTVVPHASQHEDGGIDEINVDDLSGLLADPQTPLSHATTHENGGADEIDVGGLSGVLADPQTPASHASTHQNGGSDEINVAGLSGVLADPQTPATHATTHQNGGADEISVAGLSGVLADRQDADKLYGNNISSTAPTRDLQVLTWDDTGSEWEPREKNSVTTVNTSTYSIIATDETLLVDYSATGTCDITLTTAGSYDGRVITIKDSGNNCFLNNITVDTEGSQTIEGNNDAVLDNDGMSLTLQYRANDTDWKVI